MPVEMWKTALSTCGKSINKQKTMFINTFTTGSENMSGFPQFHRLYN